MISLKGNSLIIWKILKRQIILVLTTSALQNSCTKWNVKKVEIKNNANFTS